MLSTLIYKTITFSFVQKHAASIADPGAYWSELARRELEWFHP